MTDYYMGIDPGKKGGLAIIHASSGEIAYMARFDGKDPVEVLEGCLNLPGDVEIALEDVHAMPGQGVVSMFTFGRGLGELVGYIRGRRGGPPILISPQAWQKWLPEVSEGEDRTTLWVGKTHGLDGFIFERCTVPHSGCIDAACLAEYLRRVRLGVITFPVKRKARGKLRPIKL